MLNRAAQDQPEHANDQCNDYAFALEDRDGSGVILLGLIGGGDGTEVHADEIEYSARNRRGQHQNCRHHTQDRREDLEQLGGCVACFGLTDSRSMCYRLNRLR